MTNKYKWKYLRAPRYVFYVYLCMLHSTCICRERDNKQLHRHKAGQPMPLKLVTYMLLFLPLCLCLYLFIPRISPVNLTCVLILGG